MLTLVSLTQGQGSQQQGNHQTTAVYVWSGCMPLCLNSIQDVDHQVAVQSMPSCNLCEVACVCGWLSLCLCEHLQAGYAQTHLQEGLLVGALIIYDSCVCCSITDPFTVSICQVHNIVSYVSGQPKHPLQCLRSSRKCNCALSGRLLYDVHIQCCRLAHALFACILQSPLPL